MAPSKDQPLKRGVRGGLREQVKAERVRAIMSVARDLFREKGFDQATTLEIAERAGVGAGTVFKYFPTKEALLFAVVHMDLTAVHRRAVRAAASETGLFSRLMILYRQVLEFHLANADLSRAFIRLLTPPPIRAPEIDDGPGPQDPLRATMRFVAQAASACELKADIPVEDFAENCFAVFVDVLQRALMGDPAMADPHERLAQRLELQIRHMLRSAP